MTLGFRVLLSQYRAVWKLRARASHVRLRLLRCSYRAHRWGRVQADGSAALLSIFQVTLGDVIYGGAIAGLLWLLNPYVTFLPPLASEAAYVQLLAVIAGVGGVFIGLYYTALTAAMSAVYARLPATVRQLLLEERLGNAYMRLVATTTFLALIFLALRGVGVHTPSVVVPVLALLSGFAVFGFVRLGGWAFRLFDPTAIAYLAFRNLRDAMNQVQAGGYRWREPTFQEDSRREAEQALQTLKDLADVCRKSPHLRDGALAQLAAECLAFAARSVATRRNIPTTSRWFPGVYVQPEWYRTSDSVTSVAHDTGTLLLPEVQRQAWWVEHACTNVAVDALNSFVGRGADELARQLMSGFESYVTHLGKHGHLTQATELIGQLRGVVIDVVARRPTDETHSLDTVSLVDCVGRLSVATLLGAGEWADSLGTGAETVVAAWLQQLNGDTPYWLDISPACLPRAELLSQELQYECWVSDVTVTPTWCVAELLMQPQAEAVSATLRVLVRDVAEQFSSDAERLRAADALWPAAACSSAAFHYLQKAQAHLGRFEAAAGRLAADRRITGLRWPADDPSELRSALVAASAGLVDHMAGLLPALTERPTGVPDFAGQFLHTCVEEIFAYILDGDVDRVERVFPAVFTGCLTKHDALLPQTAGPEDAHLESALALAVAPVIDLAELSGYSLLLSELESERATWPAMTKVWDGFLNGSTSLCDRLAITLKHSKTLFMIQPRAILRTTWRQKVESILRELPHRAATPPWYGRTVVDHSSELVQAVAGDGRLRGSYYDGSDIFAACYLAKRPGFEIGHLHSGAEALQRAIQRRRDARSDVEGRGG